MKNIWHKIETIVYSFRDPNLGSYRWYTHNKKVKKMYTNYEIYKK